MAKFDAGILTELRERFSSDPEIRISIGDFTVLLRLNTGGKIDACRVLSACGVDCYSDEDERGWRRMNDHYSATLSVLLQAVGQLWEGSLPEFGATDNYLGDGLPAAISGVRLEFEDVFPTP